MKLELIKSSINPYLLIYKRLEMIDCRKFEQ